VGSVVRVFNYKVSHLFFQAKSTLAASLEAL
jgi:hypothetical protein